MNTQKHIAVIGAGIAGMETSIHLARSGFKVTLIEKNDKTGGHLTQWSSLFPDLANPQEILAKQNANLMKYQVKTIYNTEITAIEKNKDNFVVKAGNELSVSADGVVIGSGFKPFDATRKEEYGYGLFENVITSVDLEQILKHNREITTASGKKPKRIAIVHCVGSRDAKSGNTYCSKVCCITGIKQAIELNKRLPDCEIFCFYMDLRLNGLRFDDLYLKAQMQHKIQFIRGRLSEAAEKQDKSLQIKAEDTLSGRPLRMDVDMLLLLVGMEASALTIPLKKNGVIDANQHGFMQANNEHAERNLGAQPGVFLAGSCACPMSVNETLENARSAALEVISYFN